MKPIARYEQRYKVSEEGEVLNRANNTNLTPIKNPNGYFKVSLADGNGGNCQVSIHRLVALHYLPNPYGYPQVNHIDGDKTNNCVGNLEWCSGAENSEHALRTGLRSGYMSADDKERYVVEVLQGLTINDLAARTGRLPETLHKMLRTTAERLGIKDQWTSVMKEKRRETAIRNLEKINNPHFN